MEFSGIDHFKGTHYEMGLQQGRLYKANIKDGMKLLKKQEEFKKLKPKGVPSQIFWRIAKKKAIKWLKPYIQEKAPNQAERIRGIAKGALGLPFGFQATPNSTELPLDCVLDRTASRNSLRAGGGDRAVGRCTGKLRNLPICLL